MFYNFSGSGFCNYSQTTSSEYGNRMWSEAAVGEVSRIPCTEGFITRVCMNNGSGWSSPDYRQCRRGSGKSNSQYSLLMWTTGSKQSDKSHHDILVYDSF